MTPVVAIVGRPNVGKSTLFNRMVGERVALVDDRPGVTRDRHYGEAVWQGRNIVVIDTGGFEPDPNSLEEGDLFHTVRTQAEVAVEEADVVLFVVDRLRAIFHPWAPHGRCFHRSYPGHGPKWCLQRGAGEEAPYLGIRHSSFRR